MEKFADIIVKMENQKLINPPDNLVSQVMVGVEKVENDFVYRLIRFLYQSREPSADLQSIISGRVISYQQCVYLLLIIGLFYLITGLFVVRGLHQTLEMSNIDWWLRMQPYFAVITALLLILTGAFIHIYKQKAIITARNLIIVHTTFIVVNACILESILFLPAALIFVLILTAVALLSEVLLIISIQNFIHYRTFNTGSDCAQNI
jgi:uncharacterized membrane protein